MPTIQAALQAHARGFTIFPVAAGSKVPHRFASYHDTNGVQHGWGETATDDFNRIVHFWTKIDPHANVGVACKNSELLVVDLDRAKEDWNLTKTEWAYLHGAYGPRVDGEALLDEMRFAQDGDMPDTYTVRTGSGGLHLYYRWPSSWPKISQASPVKGVIDVRGNGGQWGGYVLGAGSVTDKGAYEIEDDSPVALPPKWIRLLVAERPQAPKFHRPQGIRQPGPISWSGLVESVRNAQEGNRNNSLVWAARSMYSDRASLQECKDTLGPAAAQAGLPGFEIERTIESAYRVQQQKEG